MLFRLPWLSNGHYWNYHTIGTWRIAAPRSNLRRWRGANTCTLPCGEPVWDAYSCRTPTLYSWRFRTCGLGRVVWLHNL